MVHSQAANRIALLGSPDFAVASLRGLIETGAHVVGVVTQPDKPAGRGKKMRPPPVKVYAESVDLPVFQPGRIRGGVLRRWFEDNAVDLAIVAAYGKILTRPMLAAPRLGCVNVHASLLPRWRGASPIHRAIAAGDPESGVCLMQMDTGLDTGAVLARIVVPIDKHDTSQTLHDKLATAGAELLVDRLDALLAGELEATPQTEDGATYAPLLCKADGEIDWKQDARGVDAHLRAMTPWPGAWTTTPAGERWKVFGDGSAATIGDGEPGTLLASADGCAVVACAKGAVRIAALQRPGKRRADAASVLRGARIEVGQTLGVSP